MSEDSSVLGELLQDVGGGGGREPKHCHPALSWTISTVQRLPGGRGREREREREIRVNSLHVDDL